MLRLSPVAEVYLHRESGGPLSARYVEAVTVSAGDPRKQRWNLVVDIFSGLPLLVADAVAGPLLDRSSILGRTAGVKTQSAEHVYIMENVVADRDLRPFLSCASVARLLDDRRTLDWSMR